MVIQQVLHCYERISQPRSVYGAMCCRQGDGWFMLSKRRMDSMVTFALMVSHTRKWSVARSRPVFAGSYWVSVSTHSFQPQRVTNPSMERTTLLLKTSSQVRRRIYSHLERIHGRDNHARGNLLSQISSILSIEADNYGYQTVWEAWYSFVRF